MALSIWHKTFEAVWDANDIVTIGEPHVSQFFLGIQKNSKTNSNSSFCVLIVPPCFSFLFFFLIVVVIVVDTTFTPKDLVFCFKIQFWFLLENYEPYRLSLPYCFIFIFIFLIIFLIIFSSLTFHHSHSLSYIFCFHLAKRVEPCHIKTIKNLKEPEKREKK